MRPARAVRRSARRRRGAGADGLTFSPDDAAAAPAAGFLCFDISGHSPRKWRLTGRARCPAPTGTRCTPGTACRNNRLRWFPRCRTRRTPGTATCRTRAGAPGSARNGGSRQISRSGARSMWPTSKDRTVLSRPPRCSVWRIQQRQAGRHAPVPRDGDDPVAREPASVVPFPAVQGRRRHDGQLSKQGVQQRTRGLVEVEAADRQPGAPGVRIHVGHLARVGEQRFVGHLARVRHDIADGHEVEPEPLCLAINAGSEPAVCRVTTQATPTDMRCGPRLACSRSRATASRAAFLSIPRIDGERLVIAAVNRHRHLRHAKGGEALRELRGHRGAVGDEFNAALRLARPFDHVQKSRVNGGLAEPSECQREPVRRGGRQT